MKVGIRRVRRAAVWGKKTYAGSVAEDVWRRLDSMDLNQPGHDIRRHAADVLLPFLIVASALAGRTA
jgi:membrane protein